MSRIYEGIVTLFESNKSVEVVDKERLEAAQENFENFSLNEQESAALQEEVVKINEEFERDIEAFKAAMNIA